jgi:hypothetical protein
MFENKLGDPAFWSTVSRSFLDVDNCLGGSSHLNRETQEAGTLAVKSRKET